MKRVVPIAMSVALLCASAAVVTGQEEEPGEIPKTFHGAGEAFEEGGEQIKEGFRGVGRGLKKTFTGEESKEDYQEGKKIGTGFRDLGRGTAGGGRAVGRGLKQGFKQNEQQGEGLDSRQPRANAPEQELSEEPLE